MKDVANRVSVVTIIVNIILSVLKLILGIISKSSAIISDAVHSASDVVSTFVVIIGIHLADKEADKEHPYGHERLECIAAIILAMILAVTGGLIGYNAVEKLIKGNSNLSVPGELALVAAIVSIILKEWMFWYTKMNAEKIKSGALMADAWHHRSDSLSSIGALIGVWFARHGYVRMDAIASIIIFLFIAKAAYDIFIDAIDKLIDKSCDIETEKEIYNFVKNNRDIESIDLLQTRMFGNKIYVDLEVGVNQNYTLKEAHSIAEDLHDSIEREFSDIKHIMVHVNPVEA